MSSDILNLFTDETLKKWHQISPSLHLISVMDKGLIYRQGFSCPHVFLIKTGIVKLNHVTEQGNEWTVALLKRGDIIGSLQTDSSINGMEETALALGDAMLYRFEHHEFKKLISQHPDLSWQFFEMQCLRRQRAERKLLNILAQTVDNRIIQMLKELVEMFGIRCTHGYALEIRLTQQELADLVGASRSVVSTLMNDLRNRGMLNYTRELICIKDVLFSSTSKGVEHAQ